MAGRGVVEVIGPSHHWSDDPKAAVESAVNCFPRLLSAGKRMQVSIPGEVGIANVGAEGRGSFTTAGRWFVVAGATLYEMINGAPTARGQLRTAAGFVGMAANSSQLAIVDGPYLYIFTLATNVLTQVASTGWRGSDDVQFIDGYFVFVDPETEQFYISAIDDGTELDALDFSSADSSPDNIITHRVSHRQIWFFGSESTEIWVNDGGATFPFVRYQSYTLDIGVVGKRAVISAADTLFWVGKTLRGTAIVYMAASNQPRRVSSIAVEKALKACSDITQVSMWAYQTTGHEFIGINAPGMGTWVYDAAMELWHERGEWDDVWSPLRSRMHVSFEDEIYAIDEVGNIVRLDETVHTLNTRTLKRERTWPHFIADSMEPTSYRGLELAVKSGEGGNIALQISNDGGFTFGAVLIRSLGAAGRWMQKVRWLNLGTAVNRVFRIWQTDAVPFAIHSASVDAE